MKEIINSGIMLTLQKSSDCKFANKVQDKIHFCYEVRLSTDSVLFNDIYAQSEIINPKLNPNGANTSEKRPEEIIEIDNFAGLIAERVCKNILEVRYGKNSVSETSSTTSKNQIDIILLDKTIEVRSSLFPINIANALFGKKTKDPNEYVCHIVGPYANGYKKGETIKDYYIFVLFPFAAVDFWKVINSAGYVPFYVIGGATATMIKDDNIARERPLKTNGAKSSQDTLYRVVPFEFGLDILELFLTIEDEQPILLETPYCKMHRSNETDLVSLKGQQAQYGKINNGDYYHNLKSTQCPFVNPTKNYTEKPTFYTTDGGVQNGLQPCSECFPFSQMTEGKFRKKGDKNENN